MLRDAALFRVFTLFFNIFDKFVEPHIPHNEEEPVPHYETALSFNNSVLSR